MNNRALGQILESHPPRLGDHSLSCLLGYLDRRPVRHPEGNLDRYSPIHAPRGCPGSFWGGYPLSSVRCSVRSSPGWSDGCGPGGRADCRPCRSRRGPDRCPPDCSVDCSRRCSPLCSTTAGSRRGWQTKSCQVSARSIASCPLTPDSLRLGSDLTLAANRLLF